MAHRSTRKSRVFPAWPSAAVGKSRVFPAWPSAVGSVSRVFPAWRSAVGSVSRVFPAWPSAAVWLLVLFLPSVASGVAVGNRPLSEPPHPPDAWWVMRGTAPAERLGQHPLGILLITTSPVEKTTTLDFKNRRMEMVWTSDETRLFGWSVPLSEYVHREWKRRAREAWVEALRSHLRDRPEEAGKTGMSFDIPVTFPRQVEAIIGQGANLDVTGSETISFRGESTYRVDELETEFGRRSKFPQLDMKQRLRVNLDGTIGEKVHVLVNHDSEVQSALENRIKLRYDGREDEIVKSIEMGNTDLSITGAQFVSYRGTHQGLFGAKMLAQVGALDLSVIASKREGKSARSTFVGKAAKDSLTIYDIEYQKRKYYALRMSVDPHAYVFDSISDLPVRVSIWVDDHDVTNDDLDGAVPGYAYLMAPDEETFVDSVYTVGKFTQLIETEDYYMDPGSGMVTFYQPLRAEYTVAVSYADSGTTVIGNAPPGVDLPDTLLLKMLKPRKELIQNERWAYTRGYEFKQFYFLGSRNILADDFDLVIRRKRTGSESIDPDRQGDRFFTDILGLDRRDNLTGTSEPDGKVDPEYVDYNLGVLQFPDLRPFDPNPSEYPLEETNPELYELYEDKILQRPQDYQKYYIEVKYRTPQTSYSLNQINILEGSEKVILNGRQLQRGSDYSIIYEIGRVDLLGAAAEEAQKPEANISIDFEYAPFLSLAQQSLVGASGRYTISDKKSLGFAWLYESKSTPEERPRLGQEPSRYQVGDLNGRFEFNPSFMTRLVDALPLVQADAQSSLKLSGEIAASFPNPNTKNEVYVDDMEGTEDSRVFSITRRGWVPASIPPAMGTTEHLDFDWYNPRNRVKRKDVYPGLSEQEGDESLTILELDASWAELDSTNNWIGLMRLISKSGTDLSESKFLQIVYNDGGENRGKLHIDLGSINEDFYEPNKDELNTEDANSDGILDADEDTGLDGVSDEDASASRPDDGDDNYDFSTANADDPGGYRQINGTEKNTLLDTEDLDRDGGLGVDSYFSKTVDLSNLDPALVAGDSLLGTWRVLQIPLADFGDERVGDPMWESIRYARIWCEGLAWWKKFQILSMEAVGNRWLERGIRSIADGDSVDPSGLSPGESFTLKVVNNKENPEYDPPFDPGEERGSVGKRGQREQSLVFAFDELTPGHLVSARKEIHEVKGNPSLNDYTRYAALDFWLKGYSISPTDEQPVFFLRLASDRRNFYEYRVRLTGGWRQIRLDLERLPRVKLQSDTTSVMYEGQEILAINPALQDSVLGQATEAYAVYGQPSLTKIVQITGGIMNDRGVSVTGEVWFNEIRLREIKKDVGVARRVTASAQFSDFISLSGDLRQVEGDFASLGKNRTGRDQTEYSVEAKTEMGKLVRPLGLKIPVTTSYRKSEDAPQLLTGSDIILDAKSSEAEKTESRSSALGISVSKPRASTNPLVRVLIDGWSVSASRSEQKSSSPVRREYSENTSASAAYRLTTQRPGLRVFRDVEIAYLPKALRLSIDGRRQISRSWDVLDNRTREELRYDRVVRTASGTGEMNVSPVISKTLNSDYTFRTVRDLLPNKNVGFEDGLGFGNEVQRSHTTKITYKPTILSFLSPTLSYDTSYQEDQSPSIRQPGDPVGTRKATASSTIRWTFNLKMSMLQERLGGGRGKGRGKPVSKTEPPVPEEGNEPEAEEDEQKRDLWLIPIDLMASRMEQLNATFSIQRNSAYQRIPERPDWKYQFGLASGLSSDLAARSLSQGQDTRSEKRSTSLQGSVVPIFDIVISSKYQSTEDTRWVAAGARESKSRTWPDLGWSYSGLEQFAFINKVVTRASVQSGYVRNRSSSGPLGREEQTKVRTEWSPLLSVNATVRGGVSSTISVGRSTEESDDLTGAGVQTRSVRGNYQLSLKYSFTLPEGVGMPLKRIGSSGGGGGKVALNLDVTYSTDKSENLGTGNVTAERSRLSIIPKATYTFSRNMNGNLNAKFAQDSDAKRGQTTRTIGLGVELSIKF